MVVQDAEKNNRCLSVPKLLHQIWVGPRPAPHVWLRTWQEKHPQWCYRLWTNRDLSEHSWTNRHHIAEYMRRGRYNGVADLMRYEILWRYGGVVVAADSVCLHPIDELFEDGHRLYTIATDFSLYQQKRIAANRGSTTPLYAAAPRQPFTARLITELYQQRYLGAPVRSTGNRFMQRMLRRHKPHIKVWPMHYFIGEHFNGWRYEGPDRVYARHFWGTTRNTYPRD